MKLLKSFLLGLGFLGLTTTMSFAGQAENVVTVVETFYVVEDCEPTTPTPPVQASEPFAPLAIMAALAGMSFIRRRKNITN